MKKVIISGLIWISLGFGNVFWAGKIDKRTDGWRQAPTTLLFLTGPFGTAICAYVEFLLLLKKVNLYSPLDEIYKAGYDG